MVRLKDERVIALPLWLYPSLLAAPSRQQRHLEVIAGGRGLHWPDLNLDLSVRGMLEGRPEATRSARATARTLNLKNYARVLAAMMPARRSG
jgi:hypothetical protein